MDSSNDALFDLFLAHPAFRDLPDLSAANFERRWRKTGVTCPVGYKKETKRLRDG